MQILIVGRGSIAEKHHHSIKMMGYDVKFFSNIINDELNKKTSKLESFEKVLFQFDAVVIANSTHEHFEYAKIALKYEKKIYLEKPPCMYANELNQLMELNNASSNLIGVGFQLRFSEALKLLKTKILQNKDNLLYFSIHVGQDLSQWRKGGINTNSYYTDTATGGGALYELSHELDLAFWLFGEPHSFNYTSANIKHKDFKINDFFHSVWTYKDMIGLIHMNMIDPVYSRYVEVIFSDHKLKWDIEKDTLIRISPNETILLYQDRSFERSDLTHRSIKNFLDWAQGKDNWKGCLLEENIFLISLFQEVNIET